MTCAEAEPLLPLVADGAVDPDSDPQLFAHLAACPDCQRIVASHDLIALAIARPAPPRRRPLLLRWWPYAAAAGLALAVLGATSSSSPSDAPVAAHAPAAAVTAASDAGAPASASAPAAIPSPDVIALPRGDGTSIYLVRQGDGWVTMDPAALDGPVQPGHGGGSGVQVRY